MDMTLIILGLAFAGVTLALVLVISRAQAQAQRAQDIATATSAERERELDDKVGELNRINAQLAGQMLQLQQQLNERHSELTRTLSERLDNVSKRVGDSMEATTTTTAEKLTALGERLVRIDEAQKEITGLTKEVVLLKDILANKQSRGAFGQTRMEAIIRDSMPVGSYDFQFTLTNGKRPDCILRLPNDKRVLVIDSKFPLESFTAFRDAKDDGARKQAEAALRESEERWQFALEGSGDGVWDWNAETNQVFFSPGWKRMLGYAEDEVSDILADWHTHVHPDDRARIRKEMHDTLSQGSQQWKSQFRSIGKDGATRRMLLRAFLVKDHQEKASHLLGLYTDLTDLT